jgi:bis(5'-nucleosidyl)-tetraphosphatase
MRTEERSAGFVVFRQDAASRGRLFLLLDHGRFWSYPKGHVDQGEDDLAAARRELREETGISDVRIVPGFTHQISYEFHKKTRVVRKTVVYFLAESSTGDVRISHEHVGFAWLNYDQALATLNYESAKQVLRAAAAHL